MRIDLLSLFPEYFQGPFDVSILKRARERGIVEINLIDIRDFAEDKHQRVDDRPFGGGPGMVMKVEPIVKAIRSVKKPGSKVVYLSAQGTPLSAQKSEELSQVEHLILLCGHYEGIDERAIELEGMEELSIGDYVLTSGGAAAIVVIDALCRFIPGVLGHPEGAEEDSFQDGIFEGPQYTRPPVFEGKEVPEVLLQGNHRAIEAFRKQKGLEKTRRVRPDLCKEKYCEPNSGH